MTPIAPHIAAFLRERLPRQRGASEHTCEAYAYAFKLLFEYVSARFKVPPSQLSLEQIDAPLITDFLGWLESERGNSPSTRNARLVAALRGDGRGNLARQIIRAAEDSREIRRPEPSTKREMSLTAPSVGPMASTRFSAQGASGSSRKASTALPAAAASSCSISVIDRLSGGVSPSGT